VEVDKHLEVDLPMAEWLIQVKKKAATMVADIHYLVEREETVVILVADKR
jgi:hypothetical protein